MSALTGQHDALADWFETRQGPSQQLAPEVVKTKAKLRRETLKQCAQSELLSTASLVLVVVMEQVCGQYLVTRGMDTAARMRALGIFCLVFVFQVGALALSHAIVEYKERLESRALGPNMTLPTSKRYHCFITHKKELKETEEWAVHVKDQLRSAGFEVFFDVDNLKEINQGVLNAAIRDSCVLFVLLDNLTFHSKWCRDEVAEAARQDVPIRFIVHTDRFMTRALIDQWYQEAPEIASLAFAQQAIEYSTTYREAAMGAISSVLTGVAGVCQEGLEVGVVDGQAQRRQSTMSALNQNAAPVLVKTTGDQEEHEHERQHRRLIFTFRVMVAAMMIQNAKAGANAYQVVTGAFDGSAWSG
jgi:hypothetical protein